MSKLNQSQKTTIEFLTEDFKDTSSHLITTGKKVEYTFQLFAGLLSLTITATATLATIGKDTIAAILLNSVDARTFSISVCIVLVIFGLFTLWVFEFCLKGSMLNSLYINRMNYLRMKIFKTIRQRSNSKEAFNYIAKVPIEREISSIRVGMTALFPLALQFVFSFFILPLFVLFTYIAIDPNYIWINNNLLNSYLLLLVGLGVSFLTFIIMRLRWSYSIKETEYKINAGWGNKPSEIK
jgi:hypothetical protein